MALVNCPKCGKQISNTSTKCVNCGTGLKACPECGALITEESSTCDKCGYVFASATAEDKPKDGSAQATQQKVAALFAQYNNRDMEKEWLNSKECKSTKFMLINASRWAFLVLAVICIIVVIYISVKLDNGEYHGDISKIKSIKSVIITLSVFAGIFDAIHMSATDLVGYYKVIHLGNWLQRNKIDTDYCAACIIKNREANKWIDPYKNNFLDRAVYYCDHKEDMQKRLMLFGAIHVLISLVTNIILVCFLITAESLSIEKAINGVSGKFEVNYPLLVVGIICWLGGYALSLVESKFLAGKAYAYVKDKYSKIS